jgi:hypothetical protein
VIWRRVALIFALSCRVWAEKPALDAVDPAGIARGGTNSLTLFGKFDPWPPNIWSQGEGISFNFETNKGKLQVTVESNAAAGPRLLRLYSDDGASEPRIIVVTEKDEPAEREPNDHYAKAQALTNFPVTVNGRLEKNDDVDSFAIHLRAGEWLDARMESHALMSTIDPVLRLLTTNGFQIAWNHDFDSLDPRLIWRSPRDQTVILQAFGFVYPANAEIRLSGGSGGLYRLHLSTSRMDPSPLVVSSTDRPLILGQTLTGKICPSADCNRHPITLKKDQWIEARVNAAEMGSPLDPWVAICDFSGKELARNDDAEGTRDSLLEWKSPADAEYTITVGSVTHQARDDFRYRLTVRELKPGYAATIAESSWKLMPGETNQVKIKVRRLRGFTNELSFAFANLPAGVNSDAPKVDAKGEEITLSLIAQTNAPATSGPFAVIARDLVNAEERAIPFELISRSQNNGVPGGYSKLLIERLDELWLTVGVKPVPGKDAP